MVKRDSYMNRLIHSMWNGEIKVITGIRRCGKSVLLFDLFFEYLLSQNVSEDHILKIELDQRRYYKFRNPITLCEYVESTVRDRKDEKFYLFIDEVQFTTKVVDKENGGIEVTIYDMLNELKAYKNLDVYVTGSNSKLLTKDVLTAFRGRGDEVRIYPLSFKEYYNFVGGDKSEAYEEYAMYGGMPLTLSKKNDMEKMQYLRSLFDEVYFKDISERYDIELKDVLEELTDDLCSSIGSLTNSSKIARTLQSVKQIKVSSNTISKYLDYLVESFLFQVAKRYDVKGKKYFEYPSKYYCTDIGLRNAKLNFRQQEETHIMENIMYNELLCRGYFVDVGVVEFVNTKNGKKSKTQVEIDFVVNAGSKKYYIQSALNLSDDEKMNTELRPLKNTNDFFKKIIVSKTSMKPWTDEDGILHLGLYEFLLNDHSLDL